MMKPGGSGKKALALECVRNTWRASLAVVPLTALGRVSGGADNGVDSCGTQPGKL